MTNALNVKSATKTALVAALMCGSSLAAAQDAAVPAAPSPVVEVPPAAPAPVTPPPAVRTLPSTNDVVNPAASQQVLDDQQEKSAPAATERKRTAAAVKARSAEVRPASEATPVPTRGPAPETAPPAFNEPALTSPLPPSDAAPVSVTNAEPVDQQTDAATSSDGNRDDLSLFGGIAAALAALGIGGSYLARRRRDPVAVRHEPEARRVMAQPEPRAPAPEPVSAAPIAVETAATPVVSAEPSRERPQVNTRPDIPVTDPLFSRKVVPGPITDPMFAPRNDVQTPITDPLFAKHQGFAGRFGDPKPATAPMPEPVK